MDPLTITASAVSLAASIGKLSVSISRFVFHIREARNDMDLVLRELVSLETILRMLAEDASNPSGFPDSLCVQIMGILNGCDAVTVEITQTLSKYEPNSVLRKGAWALSGRDDMSKLRGSLEAHKAALNIALDMLAMYVWNGCVRERILLNITLELWQRTSNRTHRI